jgi:hypothetical protein
MSFMSRRPIGITLLRQRQVTRANNFRPPREQERARSPPPQQPNDSESEPDSDQNPEEQVDVEADPEAEAEAAAAEERKQSREVIPTFIVDDVQSIQVDNEQLKRDFLVECKCPVCYQYMKEIVMCKRGHNFCKTCGDKVTFCPTCRAPGPRFSQNHAMEQIFRKYFAASIKESQIAAVNKMNSVQEVAEFLKDHMDANFQLLRHGSTHLAFLQAVARVAMQAQNELITSEKIQQQLPTGTYVTQLQTFFGNTKSVWLRSVINLLCAGTIGNDPCVFVYMNNMYCAQVVNQVVSSSSAVSAISVSFSSDDDLFDL